jgi:CheY-like chemotaxis protein
MGSASVQPCVMIVEDDRDLRESLAEILESEGYAVAQAANGQEALVLLQSSRLPCLILLDLTMPVMNGWEFLQQQRQDPFLAQIPVAILSALSRLHASVPSLGAVRVFEKPVKLDDLLQTVERYCH